MTPWVLRLILANVFVFLLQGSMSRGLLNSLVLVPAYLPVRPWTVLTYQFLHGGFLHLALNMLALFFFGPRLEMRLGGRRFLGLYLASGIGGAVLSFLTPYSAIIGASGAVFGVLLAFARYYPRERIYIWGILPVESRILVILLAVFSLYAGFSGAQASVAHFAHLGGFVGGWVFLRLHERTTPAARFRARVETPTSHSSSVLGGLAGASELKRWAAVDVSRLHPINRDEYERLLQKAKDRGLTALTESDRAFLDRMCAGCADPGPSLS
jgi:membrane associated rhomboid family serine protease